MPSKRTPPTLSLGYGGLKQFAGRVNEEFHPNLRGTKAAKVFEEMAANDAVVGAILYAIESFLRKMKWKVEGEDEAEVEFLKSCMDDMEAPWEDFISDVLSFLVFGYSLHEVVYKIRRGPEETNPRYYSESDDGRIGWRSLALRPQSTIDRWEIDPVSGEIKGAWQKPPLGTTGPDVFLPMDRCVLFRTRPYKNNPEGKSILRNAYRSWYLKKRIEEIEAIGLARDLNGLVVVQVPPQIMSTGASTSQRAARATMEELASKIHRDELEGIVFPSYLEPGETNVSTGYKIELLSTNGGQKSSADPIVRRYDARIAMSVAAEFLILGTEKQGSFALGAEKSANFLRTLHWYGQVVASTLNKGPVRRLFEVNAVPPEKRARIVPGDLETPDLMAFGTFLGQLAANGLLHPTPAIEQRLREISGLPEEEEELEALFEEEKQLEEEQRQLDAEVARAGMEQGGMVAEAKVNASKQPKPSGKPKPKAKPK